MHQILGAIDGTGVFDGDDYEKDFANSHVKKISNLGIFDTKHYIRGPYSIGITTQARANLMAMWIMQQYALQKTLRAATKVANAFRKDDEKEDNPIVYLTGYSRGGAAVINVCHQLKTWGIPVHCLMLFDAVDRSPMGNTDVIPSNVKYAFHARRDPKARSRESFSNCGLRADPGVIYKEKYVFATHGGVGGTPWAKEHAGPGRYINELDEETQGAITSSFSNGGNIFGRAAAAAAGPLSPIISPIAGRAGEQYGKNKAAELIQTHGNTQVTVEQDKAGSSESWRWMKTNLSVTNHFAPFMS